MDGRRVPPSSITNIVDADVIPQLLIERVDTVTGGAGTDTIRGEDGKVKLWDVKSGEESATIDAKWRVQALAFARSRWLAWIDACGRHSLEVFSLGTLLTADTRGFSFDCRLSSIHVTLNNDGSESIEIKTSGETVI